MKKLLLVSISPLAYGLYERVTVGDDVCAVVLAKKPASDWKSTSGKEKSLLEKKKDHGVDRHGGQGCHQGAVWRLNLFHSYTNLHFRYNPAPVYKSHGMS